MLYDMVPDGETELNCNWGDGVLEDTEAEYQRRWSMVGCWKAENRSVSCVVFRMLGGRGKEHDAGAGSQIPTEE